MIEKTDCRKININSVVTIPHMTTQDGTSIPQPHMGSVKFFVDVVDEEGGIFGVWDGQSYEQAIMVAAELSAEGLGPVVDNVAVTGTTH